jgi:hypothetical protein
MAITSINMKPGLSMTLNQLPPKMKPKQQADRVYRTALRPDLFIKLEQEAQERGGITAYKLAQIVMTMYLEGRLVVIDDLCADTESNGIVESN